MLSGAMLLLLLPSSPPWTPWFPSHDPPFNCAELLGMSDYAEWSHQYYAWNGPGRNGNTREVDLRWVAFYQRIRPLIEANCMDAPPALPQAPLDPFVDWPF